MECLLCQSDSALFEKDTYLCQLCSVVFKDPAAFISNEEEFDRYGQHQNNGESVGYVNFCNKLVNPLVPFLPKNQGKFQALDFGSGPGPTLCHLLSKHGGEVQNFDLYFCNEPEVLKSHHYDVVTSTEVVEHFKEPQKNWELLISLVKPGGILAIMTEFYHRDIDYRKWWYKNDPTHVIFYTRETMNFVAQKNKLDIIFCDSKSVIIFRKREEL